MERTYEMTKRKITKKELSIDAIIAMFFTFILYVSQPYIYAFVYCLVEVCNVR